VPWAIYRSLICKKVNPAEKFSKDYKDGFLSAIETLKLIKKEMIERAEKIDVRGP